MCVRGSWLDDGAPIMGIRRPLTDVAVRAEQERLLFDFQVSTSPSNILAFVMNIHVFGPHHLEHRLYVGSRGGGAGYADFDAGGRVVNETG